MFKFLFNNKEYKLEEENLECFFNDEENPIEDISEKDIINILNNSDKVEFSKAFYNLPCEECKDGVEEKQKTFDFLEFKFYIYTKDNKKIISNIDREYEGKSFNKLHINGEVDNSYIVFLNVCKNCGTYSIEIEQFEL